MTTDPEYKETQGSIKLKQYVEDLLRNKHFIKTAIELMTVYGKSVPNDSAYKEVKKIIKKYKKLDTESKKYQKKYYGELNKLSNIMAEKYGLDTELLRPVLLSMSLKGEDDFKERLKYDVLQTDLCLCVDNNEEYLNSHFLSLPLALNSRKEDHLKAFPVSIDIHRFTTKRDLLDFIEKKWFWIESMLEVYRNNKKIKFRKRKLGRKFVDFIWNNKELPPKKLKNLVDQEFPNNGLVYFEFNKIISQERKRRNEKIIVGH